MEVVPILSTDEKWKTTVFLKRLIAQDVAQRLYYKISRQIFQFSEIIKVMPILVKQMRFFQRKMTIFSIFRNFCIKPSKCACFAYFFFDRKVEKTLLYRFPEADFS